MGFKRNPSFQTPCFAFQNRYTLNKNISIVIFHLSFLPFFFLVGMCCVCTIKEKGACARGNKRTKIAISTLNYLKFTPLSSPKKKKNLIFPFLSTAARISSFPQYIWGRVCLRFVYKVSPLNLTSWLKSLSSSSQRHGCYFQLYGNRWVYFGYSKGAVSAVLSLSWSGWPSSSHLKKVAS